MDTIQQVDFALKAKVAGKDITPATIGLHLFNRFNHDVEEFISGAERGKSDNIHVSIQEGSYRLVALIPAILAATLEPDLRRLEHQDSLHTLNPSRADIVRRWQTQARKIEEFIVTISPANSRIAPIVISRATDFHAPVQNEWVQNEEYVLGTVVDMGGITKANVHIRLTDKRTIVVESTEQYLREQTHNYLYGKARLRIASEKNIRTGEHRNARLLAIVGEGPSYDEMELNALIAKGTTAWADVSDPVAWVREQRGGMDE